MTQEEAGVLLAENTWLRAEVGLLQRANADLQQQLQTALEQIKKLEGSKSAPPAFVKSNRPAASAPKRLRKKRLAEHNKVRQRSEPMRMERHALERCPECKYRLRGESIDYRREVIEIPAPPPVEVIEHQVIKRWCPHCEKWQRPKLDLRGQVIGQGRIGVRVASLVSYLRTTMRLPIRALQEYLATMHHLHLSVGELVRLTAAVGEELQPQVEELKAAVRTSAVTHADETGWREKGQNGGVSNLKGK